MSILAGCLASTVDRRWLALATLAVFSLVSLSGRWRDPYFYTPRLANDFHKLTRYQIFRSGPDDAILFAFPDVLWTAYNGHNSIFIRTHGRTNPAEVMVGVIPALAAPRLDKALVLGLGTGITAGATARIFRDTDVVEVNDAFVKMVPELRFDNMAIDRNPRAKLHVADGRSFLIGVENEYDAIVNTVSAPNYFTASKIYTVEFYERVALALKADGVFSTWLSVPNMSDQGVVTILSALAASFQYCDLRVLRNEYYLTTCSKAPVTARPFDSLPARAPLPERLRHTLAPFDPDTLFEDLRISENIFEDFSPQVARQNTDDHPVLEFMISWRHLRGEAGPEFFRESQELLNIDPVRREELLTPDDFARRARVFRGFAPDYFYQYFNPAVQSDPELQRAYEGSDPLPR
jgi:hypothetical protein